MTNRESRWSRSCLRLTTVLVILLGAGGMAPAAAESTAAAAPDLAVLERARELGRTERRWNDRRQQFALRVVDERGRERRRELVMLTQRERPGDEKTLAVFLSPAEVRGTALLQHIEGGDSTAQWLFLPGLGRTRRIHGGARKQRFVGTDFSYADLDLIENALYWSDAEAEVRRMPEGELELTAGNVAYELRPREFTEPYARIVLELSASDHQLRSMRMYADAAESPMKILRFEKIQDVGDIPTAFRLEMVQPGRGSKTIVEVSGVRYDSGIDSSSFSKRALEGGLDHVE